MATRIYLPSTGAAAVSPTYDAAWEKSSEANRLTCVTNKISSSFANKTSSENVTTSPYDVLTRQYVSKPLAAQTISGTVKGQIKCQESASAADFCRALVIRIVSSDGNTVRGTLLSHFPASLTGEYSATTPTNRYFPPRELP
jgi:hypothetical protein